MKKIFKLLFVAALIFSANFAAANEISNDYTIKSIEVKSGDQQIKVSNDQLKPTDIEQVAQQICSIEGEKCTITLEVSFSLPGVGSVTGTVEVDGDTCKAAIQVAANGLKDLRDYLWNTLVKNQ